MQFGTWKICFNFKLKSKSIEKSGQQSGVYTKIFSRQGETVSRTGDRISHNFEPWTIQIC